MSQPQRETCTTLLASMRSIFSSRWTDVDLLYVLGYANGDVDNAVGTILRHEATGQPPEKLIPLLLSRWHSAGSASPHRRRSSYSENSPRRGVDGGDRPVALKLRVSEGAVVPPSYAYGFVPPSSTSLFAREEIKPPGALSKSYSAIRLPERLKEKRHDGPSSSGENNVALPENNTYDVLPDELEPGANGCPPSLGSSPSSSAALTNNLTQTEKDELLDQVFTIRRQRRDDVEDDEVLKSKQQHMLNMQSGTEASLNETRNTSEANTYTDDEALSYAVKASKETFDEEYHKQELRNAEDEKMIEMILAQSLSDPVKKSEEELIEEASKNSLTDPVQKSEDQLIEEAREKSLKDIERVETIRESEEAAFVEEMKRKSLLTMSKDEELIEAVKRQSLKDAHNDPLWRALEQSLSESLGLETCNKRQSTSTTYPLSSFVDGDVSECSSVAAVEHHPPSRFVDSPLKGSELDRSDRKMPALAQYYRQRNIVRQIRSRMTIVREAM